MDTVQQEEAQQAASLQLATALNAQEQCEATVLRPHDAALARAIAGCTDREWKRRGDKLENPLDLTGRPDTPGCCPLPPEPDDKGGQTSTRGYCDTKGKRSLVDLSDDDRGGSRHREQAQCGICFDSFPADTMWSATLPAVMASSSSAAGRCPHKFCSGCMKQYLSCEVQARRFPIYCPDPSCDEEVASADVLHLLADRPQLAQVYQALEAEQLIDKACRVYCPYKDCSALLEQPQQEGQDEAGAGQQAPYECPSCHRSFCLSCGIAGWHTGMSCQEFQALPPELKSAEDAGVLHFTKQKQWKRCPSCGHVVERSIGCNHMVCRCGCDFCYACGVRYKSKQRSARNTRGTPGCSCQLFEVPEEPADQPQPAGIVLNEAPVAGPRRFRAGRPIRRKRCRYSNSIHDCPYGPNSCWFTHDEDEEDDEQ